MDHTDDRLEEMVIYGANDNMEYVKMLVPENWTSTINTYKDIYCGYGFPYFFKITHKSLDNTAAIYFSSPYEYVDDRIKIFRDFEIDNNGILYRRFLKLEDYLQKRIEKTYSKYEKFSADCFVTYGGSEKVAERRKRQAIAKIQKEGEEYNDYYYRSGLLITSYIYNGRKRRHVAGAIINAIDYCKWSSIPDTFYMDYFMLESMKSSFPNLRYDDEHKKYIYTTMYQMDWSVHQYLEMDCLEEDFEYVYHKLFVPTINHSVSLCDDLLIDYDKKQKAINDANRKIKEENKRVYENNRQFHEERRQKEKQIHEYVRKTQLDK